MNVRELIEHNFLWKLGSLLLAVLAWTVINSATTDAERSEGLLFSQTREFDIPIAVRTAASDPRRFLIRPDHVQVELRGARDAVDELDASQISAFVDLVNVTETVKLSVRVIVHTPPGFRVLSVQPQEVNVEPLAEPESP